MYILLIIIDQVKKTFFSLWNLQLSSSSCVQLFLKVSGLSLVPECFVLCILFNINWKNQPVEKHVIWKIIMTGFF